MAKELMSEENAVEILETNKERKSAIIYVLIKDKAIEALKKQIPMKVEKRMLSWLCPNCKTELSNDGSRYKGKYCLECGQRLNNIVVATKPITKPIKIRKNRKKE